VITFPKAKINIGLRVTGRRPDGYHNIETVFYPAGLSDALEFMVPVNSPGNDVLTVTGLKTGAGNDDNIVIKAIRRLREYHRVPYLRIHLHKAIPAGAGLGGGSSDAAFFIKTIIRFFDIPADEDFMRNLALELGSDCPFFINCTPSIAGGRGEILHRVENVLAGYHILMVNPGINVSTKEAYSNCHPGESESNLESLIKLPVEEWRGKIINDFEEYVFKMYPVLGSFKEILYDSGALYSSMSGSGSTVYGIFPGPPHVPDRIKDYVIYSGISD